MKVTEILKNKKVTRRSVLQGMSAAAAAATLAGCGGSGTKTYFDESDPNLQPPDVGGEYVLGSTPHNCGGGCVSKYYLEEGVVKRIVTDEDREDGDVFAGKAQIRSCQRCRSKVDWWYRNDRLTKPLKQTKERGDITGFVEISWDQAISEIAAKIKGLYTTYGGATFYNCLAPSDRTSQGNTIANLTKLLGSDCSPVQWVLDLSYPQHTYSYFFIDHDGFAQETATSVALRVANNRADIENSDNLVLWAFNPAEARVGPQTAWYITNAREKGVKVTVIDPRFTPTAEAFADDYVGITGTTDAALMLAMLHEMIVNTWDESGNLLADPWLDEAFIRKYVHGFFDDTNPKHYYADISANATAYQVPAGASLSAYIMGTDDRLTNAVMSSEAADYTNMTAGTTVNQGVSIYPDTIGYNVPATDGLYGKTAPCYGQITKTPEWAEKITGVSADKIRELAEMYVKTKVTTWVSGGLQRHTEGDMPVNLGPILSAVTKNIGVEGRSYGFSHEVNYKYPGTMSDKVALNGNNPGSSSIQADSYDMTKLTLQGGELGPYVGNTARTNPLCNVIMMNGLSLPVWIDYVRCAGTSNVSKWNYGRSNTVTTPIKGLFCFGGNFVNQTGNSNEIVDVCTAKDGNGNYNVELILTGDLFFTASSLISDYVLPCAGPGEKWGETCGWLTAEALVMPKITDAPGEALNEFEISRRIAAAWGQEEEFKTVGDGTNTVVNTDYEWSEYNWNKGYSEGQIDQDWDAIQLVGGVNMLEQRPNKVKRIAKEAFITDPAANPLNTMSGKIEAYYQAMLEDYEAAQSSLDTVTTDTDGSSVLKNSGHIYTASTSANSTSRRFVYPIPMYIPAVEAMHADDSHPDLLGLTAKGFIFKKQTGHFNYRAHSTMGNESLLNELYKRNSAGERAYLDPSRSYTDGVWDSDIYEPVYLNPVHASELGVAEGDRVKVSNSRGVLYASVRFTNRMAPYNAGIGDGGWFSVGTDGVDIGGATNSLSSGRPSRIAFGMSMSSDDRLKIEKA
ncbi:molybdopterin-dependent oxidoreductase [Seleniivibrio sp.]|uniref:molybdopterin-containing oxidoreductase family protein n=1 Tax=Seleniivibrio sp. TaxID=2898801 RepID=UPI0025DEECD5|nr:molybdopterin-dependent oxidoreductase [Seleniivibrio sp.]MCD8554745.1 molybdopterin-dependent oxidoreductase [Seleniivibrio sp.]